MAPREGVYLVVRNLAGALGADAYASFRQKATTEIQQPGALISAWLKYREEMRETAGGRRLLDTRAETLDEFVTALVPHLHVQQVLGILDLVYGGHSFSGMPDVTCIREQVGLFVEVKAPGDSIRLQQVRVHGYLRESLHLDVWLCELDEEEPSQDRDLPPAVVRRSLAADRRPGLAMT